MLLVIDVGNTNITLGIFDGEEVVRYISYEVKTATHFR